MIPVDTSPIEQQESNLSRADKTVPVAAAIDIGSNSIKMTIARADGGGGIEQIAWASEAALLGQGLELTGQLDPARIDAAVDVLKRFAMQAHEAGAGDIVAVATEAVRVAANGREFLDRVSAETGIAVEMIAGEREAALTFRGLAATSDVSGLIVVADIGGGSTELIVAHDGVMLDAVSTSLGSGRLTDRFVSADPPTRQQFARCMREASKAVGKEKSLLGLVDGAKPRMMVLGGTGEYLGRLAGAEREIDRDALRRTVGLLLSMPAGRLAEELGIPEARARVLPAGAAIVSALVETIDPSHIEVARSGIRAGLLLDILGNETMPDRTDKSKGDDAQGAPLPDVPPESASVPSPAAVEPRFRDAMRTLIGERWEAVWAAIPAAIDGEDIEGVHAVRVASRRLRAAMDTGAPCFPPKW